MLCLVASRTRRFSSPLNKQPLHPLQLNPDTTSLASVRRPFGEAEHRVLTEPEGRKRGDMLLVVCKPLAHLWLQDGKGSGGRFGHLIL